MIHGVLNLLKPPGMTSHDAVAFVRRTLGEKRVGHTGTLDPAAAGVLPICVGQATRLVEYLQAGTKEYIAEATFGFETDSCDATGQIVRECDASNLNLETLRHALDTFRGAIEQTPPMHSAVKVGGKKLYELAREGQEIEIPTRRVTISRLLVTRFDSGEKPRAMLHIECSGGTYIRSLVRDIGRELGLAATMTFLVRTRNGGFVLNKAVTPQEFEQTPLLQSLERVVSECATFVVENDEAAVHLWQGKQVRIKDVQEQWLDECRAGAAAAKWRRTRSLHHQSADLLVRNSEKSLFILARDVGDDVFRPEKVFDLRSK